MWTDKQSENITSHPVLRTRSVKITEFKENHLCSLVENYWTEPPVQRPLTEGCDAAAAGVEARDDYHNRAVFVQAIPATRGSFREVHPIY